MSYKEIQNVEKNKKQRAFVLIYCNDGTPYKKYMQYVKENNLVEEDALAKIPMLLSINRHDGTIGFVGGKIEEGEDIIEGLKREVKEEINYDMDTSKLKKLAIFTDGNADINSFSYIVSRKELIKIVSDCVSAKHFSIEITGFALNHLYNYTDGGVSELLKQNWKATSKLELLKLLELLNIQVK